MVSCQSPLCGNPHPIIPCFEWLGEQLICKSHSACKSSLHQTSGWVGSMFIPCRDGAANRYQVFHPETWTCALQNTALSAVCLAESTCLIQSGQLYAELVNKPGPVFVCLGHSGCEIQQKLGGSGLLLPDPDVSLMVLNQHSSISLT